MGLDGFVVLDRPFVGDTAGVPPRRRWNRAVPKQFAAMRRPAAPSRRLADLRMAPATFLWLIGGWMAALAILVVVVLALRSLA